MSGAKVLPFGQRIVPFLGPAGDELNAIFRDAINEARAYRPSREQRLEQEAAEAQDRAVTAFNDVKFAIIGHISDSKAMVPNYKMSPVKGMAFGRETEIQTPMCDVIAFVMDDAPVIEALRALTANPSRETADAFEKAVAEQFASTTYEGLAEARAPS